MRLIGDVHGKYRQYARLIKDVSQSVQLGDMGVGFKNARGEFSANPPYSKMMKGDHRFIRGNHDNPFVCSRQKLWIKDGKIENDMMFVGGASSVDKEYRTKDYDWWEDEELSDKEFSEVLQIYLKCRPRVMLTHTAPAAATEGILSAKCERRIGDYTRSEKWFHHMWTEHKPELWVFGHWHHSWDQEINGTRFVCLAELEVRDDLV
jgi:hypothetical protein